MAFDQFDDDQAITGINVTPLVDITLVLLIIFMVTTSYIVNPSIKVDLPRATTGDKTKPSTLSVVLTRSQEIYLNGKRTTEAALVSHVREEIADNPDLQAVISADTTRFVKLGLGASVLLSCEDPAAGTSRASNIVTAATRLFDLASMVTRYDNGTIPSIRSGWLPGPRWPRPA